MIRRSRRSLSVVVAGVALLTLGATPAAAGQRPPRADPSLGQYLELSAVQAPTHGSGRDLLHLGRLSRSATIVGLGEAAHGLAELTRQKSRAVQYLIAEQGYRTVAWEDDWTLGIQINDYIHGRRNDRDALVGQLSREARTREVADLLTWLRDYNRTRRERVTFVGAEYFATRPLAYDAIRGYVSETAPDRLAALRPLLALICPGDDDMGAYLAWYRSVDDKAPYLKAATDLYDLVQALPHHPRDRTHAMALQHARQIRSFYTAFSLPADQVLTYRDARAAENLRWWQHFSGDRVIYWAAAAHTTTTPQVSINVEDYPATSFTPVGAYLERWYGRRYIAVGYTFNAGTMFLPPAQQVALPPAPPEWFEAPLAEVGMRSFFLDVSARMPAPVQNWLAQPTLTRGVPEAGTTSTMTGGTPRQWFDALVHTQHVSASTPLAPSPR